GIEDDLAGRRITRVVLVSDAEIEIAKWHPDALAAPAHMDHLAHERHGLPEGRASLGRQFLLEAGSEGEVTGADDQLAHVMSREDLGYRSTIHCRAHQGTQGPIWRSGGRHGSCRRS